MGDKIEEMKELLNRQQNEKEILQLKEEKMKLQLELENELLLEKQRYEDNKNINESMGNTLDDFEKWKKEYLEGGKGEAYLCQLIK